MNYVRFMFRSYTVDSSLFSLLDTFPILCSLTRYVLRISTVVTVTDPREKDDRRPFDNGSTALNKSQLTFTLKTKFPGLLIISQRRYVAPVRSYSYFIALAHR